MRKIRLAEHISLDGIIAPGGPGVDAEYADGGWTAPYRTPEGAAAVAEAQGKGFDLLLGRRTYDLWSGYWPKMKGGPFADNLNAATKYVATHRPEGLGWGPVKPLGPDAIKEIRALKAQDGPDLLLWGSASLAAALVEQALIDEAALIVYPLLLGRGKRCFPEAAPQKMTLVSSKATPSGLLINLYRR